MSTADKPTLWGHDVDIFIKELQVEELQKSKKSDDAVLLKEVVSLASMKSNLHRLCNASACQYGVYGNAPAPEAAGPRPAKRAKISNSPAPVSKEPPDTAGGAVLPDASVNATAGATVSDADEDENELATMVENGESTMDEPPSPGSVSPVPAAVLASTGGHIPGPSNAADTAHSTGRPGEDAPMHDRDGFFGWDGVTQAPRALEDPVEEDVEGATGASDEFEAFLEKELQMDGFTE